MRWTGRAPLLIVRPGPVVPMPVSTRTSIVVGVAVEARNVGRRNWLDDRAPEDDQGEEHDGDAGKRGSHRWFRVDAPCVQCSVSSVDCGLRSRVSRSTMDLGSCSMGKDRIVRTWFDWVPGP